MEIDASSALSTDIIDRLPWYVSSHMKRHGHQPVSPEYPYGIELSFIIRHTHACSRRCGCGLRTTAVRRAARMICICITHRSPKIFNGCLRINRSRGRSAPRILRLSAALGSCRRCGYWLRVHPAVPPICGFTRCPRSLKGVYNLCGLGTLAICGNGQP